MTATKTTTTASREFAATATRYFSMNSRTRRYRKGADLHAEIAEAVFLAATMPGYYTEATQRALATAYAAVTGYQKHILGYRARPETCRKVAEMSPAQFVGMLADMIDSGVSNMGDAERYFQAMA
jgi:hypothetical protein